MKKFPAFLFIVIAVTALVLTACGSNAAAPTESLVAEPEPETEPSPVPTPTETPPPEPIRQWAASARSDGMSIRPDPNWGHATYALGEPDMLLCSKYSNKGWAVNDQQEMATLEVFYEEAVIPSEINIIEGYGANRIVKVEVLDVEGNYHEAQNLEESTMQIKCPYTVGIPIEDADYEAIGLRITLEPDFRSNQIDAVELVGLPTGTTVTLPESQALVEPPAIGERAYYDRPDDFPDEYQAHVIYFLTSDHVDRERDIKGQIADSIRLANEWMEEQTGGAKYSL